MTTKLEAQNMLKRVGLDVHFQSTGHPDWQRGFIRRKGVSYGRMSFLNGKLYSTKWYGIHDIEFEHFCIQMLIKYDYLPTKEQYRLTWYWADKQAQAEYERKVLARGALPDKKRKSLQKPNAEKWFSRIFEYKWIIFRGLA